MQLESAVELELGAAIKVYGLLLNKSALRIMLDHASKNGHVLRSNDNPAKP